MYKMAEVGFDLDPDLDPDLDLDLDLGHDHGQDTCGVIYIKLKQALYRFHSCYFRYLPHQRAFHTSFKGQGRHRASPAGTC